MLATLKPKSKISFSTLAPLLATMEDSVDDMNRRSKAKKKRHNRGPSIADRVKMMLMGDAASGSSHVEEEDEEDKDEENDKLLDLHSSEGENGIVIEEPIDFTPVRDLPNQLMTEAASIVPSGSSSLADVDDDAQSRTGGRDFVPSTHQEELRCVITIIRHGDRTPKQKLKGECLIRSIVVSSVI